MIGWLKGRVLDAEQPGKLVLDVNGVGYDIETSLTTFFQVQSSVSEVEMHVHTVVREDAFLLYGFVEKSERSLFRALIKVNGVGPKLAITILSSISPIDFVQVIQQQNPSLLTRLPGIGKKTAERLVVEMKDSLPQLQQLTALFPGKAVESTIGFSRHHQQNEAIQALAALGYKQQDVIKVINQLDDGEKTCEQLIRQGLQRLSVV